MPIAVDVSTAINHFVTNFLIDDGSSYTGPMMDGKPEGSGKQKWPDSSFYEGDFVKSKREGRGKAFFVDQGSFDGDWNENMMTYGFCRYPDTSEYESYKGSFNNWLPNGMGMLKYRDGRIYEGEFIRGLPNGSGKMSHKEYSYTGQFHMGHRNGWGIQETNDIRYEGYWQNDKENGFGTMYYMKTQTHYTGYWKNSMYEGIGMRVYSTHSTEGYWEQGKIKKTFFTSARSPLITSC